MKKRYRMIFAAAGTCFFLWLLSAAVLQISGNQEPWELAWSRGEEMPYFRSEVSLYIRLKENIKPEEIKIFVNSQRQEVFWEENGTAEICFREEGKYDILLRHEDGASVRREIYVELTNPSAPKISSGRYKEGTWTREDVVLQCIGSEAVSEIDHYEYREEGGEWRKIYDHQIRFGKDMDQTVRIRAVSLAGRKGEISEIRVRIRKTKPQRVRLYCRETGRNGWYRSIPAIYWEYTKQEGPETKVYFRLVSQDTGKEKILEGRIPEIAGEGKYQLSAWAEDEAGNRSEVAGPLDLWIDSTPPEIVIRCEKEVKNGGYCAGQKVYVQIKDKNIRRESVKIKTSAEKMTQWEQTGEGYQAAVTFQKQGFHYLRAEVSDQAGNTGKQEIAFTIDSRKPEIIIKGVEHYRTYRENVKPEIIIRDQALRSSEIKIMRGKERVTEKVLSRDGHYTIEAAAEDKAGNKSVKKMAFTINKKGIRVKFENPEINGKAVNKKNFHPAFLVESMDPVQVMGFAVNGRNAEYTFKGNRISLKNPMEENGEYQLKLTVCDAAGNYKVSETILFTYDTKPPEILMEGISGRRKISYGDKIRIGLRQKEDRLTAVFLDGKEVKTGNGEMEIMPGNPGQHRLTIFAVDEAGNRTKKQMEFTVEKAMPEIIKEVMEGKKPLKESEAVNYGLIFLLLCCAGGILIIKIRTTRL